MAEQPRRDGHRLALDDIAPAPAELGRDEMAHDAAVEGIAREGDTLGAQDGAVAAAPRVGADAQQAEVARAAAEVGDEDQLVLGEPALVVIGRGHRLVLEHQRLGVEPGAAQRGTQPSHRVGVVLGRVGAGEAHRPANDDARRRAAAKPDRGGPEVGGDQADHHLQRVDRCEHLRRAKRPARQVRLHRLDEPAFAVPAEVAVDRVGPGHAERAAVAAALLGVEVEDGPERRRRRAAEMRQAHAGVVRDGDRAVRRAEVEPERRRHARILPPRGSKMRP